ncbi:rho guanine nucleotide exchange factor 10 [Gambusia affinis]|uniref:rho guanine nucleotide exchange factor 10 n=1 Tax=Gambusia affinis TaxID=33528 RepID=UPI001CDBEAED|nr:rho guanine nucleotide exchange factor 10 [Gambusia affinis]
MDVDEFPPPPPEMLADNVPFDDEDEGEPFDFDSGDDIPEAPPAPPCLPSEDSSQANSVTGHPEGSYSILGPPAQFSNSAPTSEYAVVATSKPSSAGCETTETEETSVAEGTNDREEDLPPLPSPPPPVGYGIQADPRSTDTDVESASLNDPHPPQGLPGTSSQSKVNPYSVIDITPIQLQQEQQHRPSSSTSSPRESKVREEEGQDIHTSSSSITSGYSVPVPCGYATPSGVPLIIPAYTTPVIIRHLSVDEDVTVVGTSNTSADSVFSEEYPAIAEENALAKWASDPANTAWMENPDEVIYDDVPRENSDSNTDPDEMIYDDVELGEEGGCSSSLDNGWSSSEFESYDEASDGEGRPENGLPHAFMRGKPPQRKMHLSQDLTRLKEHYEKKMKELMASTVGTVELQQLKQKHEQKRKLACFEDESEIFIEVDCFNVEPVLPPAPGNNGWRIIKTKERRLFLLNDVLMCATPNIRCQDGSGSGSGNAPLDQKFLLKWSVPLNFVEVLEFGSSEEMVDNSRYPAPHSGEKVVINAKPNKLYMGPGQLYQDLQNLIHDLSLVNQIAGMIGSLKGNYQSGLQRLILKKEEEIRAADRCRIQLQLPQTKAGKLTYFSAVFNTLSPAIKQSWISNLQMAKLALEEDNLQGWFFADDDGNHIKKQKHPLLLQQMPVVMSKLQEFKVECAVHNPEPYINTESTADSPVVGHGCVWVASCTNQMGQIAIVAMQNSSPKVTECFNVESRILCMAYVPTEQLKEDGEKLSESNFAPPAKASDTPTVCLGMEEGSIIVYKSTQRSKKIRLQHFFTPDKSTVTSLVYKKPCLYAGLVSGAVAIYSRSQDGSWSCEKPKLLKLGVLPVKAVLAVEDHLWASSGGQVFIISTHTHCVERQLEAHQEEGMVVSHMVVAGVGIWIGFSSGSTVRLFHTETLEHLQDINIATTVNNILPGNQRVSVSSLLVCHGLLLVGTNLGVTVALSVPRLQGIPKVTGRGMVSLHAHNGPVKFLTMATAVRNWSSSLPSSTPSSSLQQIESVDADSTQPVSDTASSPPQGRGVWLGEAGCTTMALQDSLSSSSCGSLAPSQVSLEHGPEDGALYDLLHDPAHHQRGRRSSKMDVSSLLVVSGGLGHRRVNKKTKQSRHEDNTSTIMIWQIPLLNM